MNEKHVTYQQLYALLKSLGFEQHPSDIRPQARVFFHGPTDTLLAFGRDPNEQVTPADLLSADVHLQAKGIVDEPLDILLAESELPR